MTKEELAIILGKVLNEEWNYITVDKNGCVCLHESEPRRNGEYWTNDNWSTTCLDPINEEIISSTLSWDDVNPLQIIREGAHAPQNNGLHIKPFIIYESISQQWFRDIEAIQPQMTDTIDDAKHCDRDEAEYLVFLLSIYSKAFRLKQFWRLQWFDGQVYRAWEPYQ